MSNRNQAKGTAFERLIADGLSKAIEPELLASGDRTIDRRVKTGNKDRGDVSGVRLPLVGRIVVEAKNEKRFRLAEWLEEAEIEAGNDDAGLGLVIFKRPKYGKALDQYCLLTVRDLVHIATGERPE